MFNLIVAVNDALSRRQSGHQPTVQNVPRGTYDDRVEAAIVELMRERGVVHATRAQLRTWLKMYGDPVVSDHPEKWGPTIDEMVTARRARWTSRTVSLQVHELLHTQDRVA